MNRRHFIRTALLGGLVLGLPLPLTADEKSLPRTTVFSLGPPLFVHSPAGALQKRFHGAICHLTGRETAAEAWRELFPDSPRVGIKLNATTPPAYARPETIALLLDGLKLAGVRPDRIIIWERFARDLEMSGWRKQLFDPAIRVLATEPQGIFDRELIYRTEQDTAAERDPGDTESRISAIHTREIDFCINVGAAKDHISAGVTLGLKSLTFGVMDNTKRFHNSACDPAIAETWALPGIGERVVLSLVDALHTVFNGGPFYHPQWCQPTDRLLVSRDPVALDRVTADLIDALRLEEGFRPIMQTGRPCRHIETAAALGLGIADRRRIEVVEG